MTNTFKRMGAQTVMGMLTVLLFLALTLLGYWVGGFCPVWGQIIMSVAVLALGWLILSLTHRWMMKAGWKILVFGGLYVFGIWVYCGSLQTSDAAIRFLSPIDNTLSIFFPSRGSYCESGFENNYYFFLLHLLAYLFFAMIAFSWFGRRFVNRSGWWLIRWRHKNVFWGYGVGGVLLAKDILGTTTWEQVIFVLPRSLGDDETEEKRIFEQLDTMGAIVLYEDFESMKGIPKAHRHFFLTDDQDFNTQQALKVARSSQRSSTSLYVRTELPLAYTLFEGLPVEARVFNQSALTARQFAKKYPMLECAGDKVRDLRVDHNFNVLMLGFSWTGRELLHKEICDAQYVGSTFSATIFDNDYEQRYGDYPTLYDECITQYNLCFNPGIPDSERGNIVGSRAFFRWCETNLAKYDRIIVALGDDSLNLNTAMALAQIARYETAGQAVDSARKIIFAHVREPQHYACYRGDSYPVTIFGDLKDVYSVEVVIDEALDRMAKAVNYVYCCGNNPVSLAEIKQKAESCWRTTTNLFNCDSSRAAAANIDNLYSLVQKSGLTFENAIAAPERLKILAQTEHLRWNAFHFTSGVRRWELSEIPDKYTFDAKLFSVLNDKVYPLLKHACLVSYEDLKGVSERVNENRKKNGKTEMEDFQETDRRIIRHYPIIRQFADEAVCCERKYVPRPLDTSSVKLAKELADLQEDLARNVHEVWAKGRLSQGWKYGSVRNDARKEHPCLVAYDELPESERAYDRNTALETLKVIRKLGWKIEK